MNAMLTAASHERTVESNKTFVVLTFDDFFLRNEWSKGLPTISMKKLPTFSDWKLLDICEKHTISATLFVPSSIATIFPDELARVAERKIEVAGHGFNHEDLRLIPQLDQTELIDNAIRILKTVCRTEILGWRAPGLFINRDVKSAISKSKVQWCSNIRLPAFVRQRPFRYYGNGKLEIPITSLLNDYNLYEKMRWPPSRVMKKWVRDFKTVRDRHGLEIFTILLHPWVEAKTSNRLDVLETFLETIKACDNFEFKTCTEVYRYFQNQSKSSLRDCLMKTEADLTGFLISRFGKIAAV